MAPKRALGLAALVLAAGCRQFPPPGLHSNTNGACSVDGDCVHGICTGGQCDEVHCRRNEQCKSLFCYGAVDGAPGTCGVRECNLNSDCPAGRICEALPQGNQCVGECATDAECPAPEGCGFDPAGKGSCGGNCRTSADCTAGELCLRRDGGTGQCGNGCVSDRSCPLGQICTANDGGIGTCFEGCRSDADCPGCAVCATGGGAFGTCINGGDGGPPIQGDPGAMHMTDNLQAAVEYARAHFPGAQLVQAVGLGLRADGTVNITDPNDYASRWTYGFLLPSGDYASVLFYNQTRKCGLVTEPDGSVSAVNPIADAVIPSLLDASQVVSTYLASGPNCTAPQGSSSDSAVYLGTGDGGAEVLLQAKSGDSFVGDAVSGQGRASCP